MTRPVLAIENVRGEAGLNEWRIKRATLVRLHPAAEAVALPHQNQEREDVTWRTAETSFVGMRQGTGARWGFLKVGVYLSRPCVY